MGINACIMGWFGSLADAGVFEGLSSVLELGPQDFFFSDADLHGVAARRLGEQAGDAICAKILHEPSSFEERQAAFYSIFGLRSYASVDSYDERASFRQNLNTASSAAEKYDVVVDCGTTEHVFNAGNVFVYTHNSLKPGGVALKVLPTFGDNTHGFYNIHPTAYFDVARENGYDILDFRYVDDMISRAPERGYSSFFTRSDLEMRLQSFAGCASIQEAVSRNFLQTLQRSEAGGLLPNAHNAVDYCFVAMRKRVDADFVFPGQGVYLTEFSKD